MLSLAPQGRGRSIDYTVVHASLHGLFSVEADLDGPWRPHVGLKANLKLNASLSLARLVKVPKTLPDLLGDARTPRFLDRGSLVRSTRLRKNKKHYGN